MHNFFYYNLFLHICLQVIFTFFLLLFYMSFLQVNLFQIYFVIMIISKDCPCFVCTNLLISTMSVQYLLLLSIIYLRCLRIFCFLSAQWVLEEKFWRSCEERGLLSLGEENGGKPFLFGDCRRQCRSTEVNYNTFLVSTGSSLFLTLSL